MGSLISLFWTDGHLPWKGWSPCLPAAINSSDSPPVWHLLTSWQYSSMTTKPFDPHTCIYVYRHWWDSNPGSCVCRIFLANVQKFSLIRMEIYFCNSLATPRKKSRDFFFPSTMSHSFSLPCGMLVFEKRKFYSERCSCKISVCTGSHQPILGT